MFNDNKKVLVIGEPIIDLTVYSDIVGMSLETPTLKARQSGQEIITLGGTGHVVNNLLELSRNGKRICWLSVIGKDRFTSTHIDAIAKTDSKLLVIDGRFNTVKSRFWIKTPTSDIDSSYKYFQLDTICNDEIPSRWREDVISTFESYVARYDVILLIDYRHGLFDDDMIKRCIEYCNRNHKPIICSSQVSNWKEADTIGHSSFRGADLIVLNEREALLNSPVGKDLPKLLDANVCVTLGSKGSKLYFKNGETVAVESMVDKTKAIDTCGAGDSFISCLSLCDWQSNPRESLRLANYWAYLAVVQPGVTVPRKKHFEPYIDNVC
jgi:bifunctional ADP-heptose synthase (sugar kinase/adenylyltransferase)